MARAALALLAAAAALYAPAVSADTHRLPDGPYFVKIRPSTRTVLVWNAVSHSPRGRFQLLRGSVDGGLHVVAVLPAYEGSHRYRYVDREVPADTETVYQLVYDNGASEVVLVTARVVQAGLRDPWVRSIPARDTDPLRTVDSQPPLVPPASLGRLPGAALTTAGERAEPPTPPPRRLARS